MLYKLIYMFHTDISWLNVFRYITFRTIVSTLASLTFLFIFGNWVIGKLRALQVGEYIRDDGPPNHLDKAGTPTMGGCLIIPVIMVSTLLWADLTNIYVWLVLFVMFCFGLIGFMDDYLKVVRRDSRGLSKKAKKTRAKAAPRTAEKPRTDSPGKLSYKETRELAGLPDKMAQLSAAKEQLEAVLADPAQHTKDPDGARALAAKLNDVTAALAAAEDRWLTLEAKREEAEGE